MEISEKLHGILATLPAKPGCYIYRNAEGTIIYVGKAIILKNRVRSYFHSDSSHDAKTRRLVREIADIEWIVVGSEVAALILEMNLIKKHRPKYNIRLKDDKRYPYIKVHWQERFPTVSVTRLMEEDGARYFGPYTSVWAVLQTLEVLRNIFPYQTCNRKFTSLDTTACIYLGMKKCLGPCIGEVSQTEYRAMISSLMDFLEGNSEDILARLQADMLKAAETLRFEMAASKRDQIKSMQTILERQKVVFATDYKDSDAIAMARMDGEAVVQMFYIRKGRLTGRDYFVLEGTEDTPDQEVMAGFIKQHYIDAANIPEQVMLPQEIEQEEATIISQWLRSKRGGKKMEFFIPKDGQPHDIVQMAAENASETLKALRTQWQADAHKQEQALGELQTALKLSAPPNRIECYDVSHTQGVATVGAMIVFEQGTPAKNLYRKFNIDSTSIGTPDDFASMEEMLTRRFKRWRASQEAKNNPGYKPDASFSFLPDLIIIDGGKGQLGRVVKVLEEFDLFDVVPVVGLAKQEEEIFFPHDSQPLLLPRHSQGLYLVQRIRDEAHRYGITAHRARRSKQGLASQLDSIPGIGPSRRKALLKHFGSMDKIREASVEELAAVKGMNSSAAESIKAHLE